MLDGYCPPNYFGFDIRDDTNNDTAFIINQDFETFNADWKTVEFMKLVDRYASIYRTNHIAIPFGCDFHYQDAKQTFKSIDRMIKYINSKYTNVTLKYSTPSEYLSAVYASDISWPTRYDDMFPLAEQKDNFWTGYFSNRPTAKGFAREGQSFQAAQNKMYALTMLDPASTDDDIAEALAASYSLYDALGIFQHHDAITGTDNQFVADDYVYRLYKSI